MDEIIKDSRFSHIAKDARFRRIPKKERKIKIDKRFQSMFSDDRFQVSNTLDKRGRPVKVKGRENLEKYYDVSSSESTDNESEQEKEDNAQEENKFVHSKKESKKFLTPAIKEKLKDLTIDYARGEGRILSDSSSDEESNEENEDDIEHAWGEMDKDAEMTEEATSRLALCNMDWDRINAEDIMVLFYSFLPPSGVIKSVTIYPSDFGLKRMAEEEKQGPSELCTINSTEENEESEELNQAQMEKLRQYQLKRLLYYYAVIVFDSPVTANHVYTECDGLEYESSMNRLDLRFIPDDTNFEQNPKETCTEIPENYKPRLYSTTALGQVKVDLTWDETDPNRQDLIKSVHSGKMDDNRLKQYLASSSDNDSDTDGVRKSGGEDDDDDDDDDKSDAGKIEKYKALLFNINNEEKKKEEEVSMEISWDLKLEQKVKDSVQKSDTDKTPFDNYLQKRKLKRKQKREAQLNKVTNDELVEAFSDDDLPSDVDLSDPYFKEEIKKGENKKKGNRKKLSKETNEENIQEKAELELLLMDEANDEKEKHHFSLKKIEERENPSKKKRKQLKRKNIDTNTEDDNFKINVKDDRFSAIYSSHLYNVDPADPQFRRTKGMMDIIEEKQRRITSNQKESDNQVPKLESKSKLSAELSVLVKSVKRKTENIKKTGRDSLKLRHHGSKSFEGKEMKSICAYNKISLELSYSSIKNQCPFNFTASETVLFHEEEPV